MTEIAGALAVSPPAERALPRRGTRNGDDFAGLVEGRAPARAPSAKTGKQTHEGEAAARAGDDKTQELERGEKQLPGACAAQKQTVVGAVTLAGITFHFAPEDAKAASGLAERDELAAAAETEEDDGSETPVLPFLQIAPTPSTAPRPRDAKAADGQAVFATAESALRNRPAADPTWGGDTAAGRIAEGGRATSTAIESDLSVTVPEGRVTAREASDPLSVKVAVLAEAPQLAPSPAQSSQTIVTLVAALSSEGGLEELAPVLRAAPTDATAGPTEVVRDLRIQLTPASLGTVDARLRIEGEQLAVEIQVETPEALKRLSVDKDSIVSALRGLGYRIDDVTIVQQSNASAQGGGAQSGRDGNAATTLSQGSGRQGDGQAGAGRQQSGNDRPGHPNDDARLSSGRPDADGLYI